MGDLYLFDIPISIGTMLYQAFIFTILIFVLHKFFFKKIIHILDNRKKLIVEQLQEVEQFKEEAKQKYIEQMNEVEVAKKEAQLIRERTNKEACLILEKARKEENNMRVKAYEDLKKIKGA